LKAFEILRHCTIRREMHQNKLVTRLSRLNIPVHTDMVESVVLLTLIFDSIMKSPVHFNGEECYYKL